jgi:transglutaminase-like putative cysteine protease
MMSSAQLQSLGDAELLDHQALDLDAASRVTYVLQQSFRYDYDGPVRALRQRLVIVPPERHGGQYRRAHALFVGGAPAQRRIRHDAHGNVVTALSADHVEQTVEFRLTALVERVQADDPVQLPQAALTRPALLRPTRLTAADDRLRELGLELAGRAGPPLDQAARICHGVHQVMAYADGVTSVGTTAAQALAGGAGVCQDFAHVMLAVCHLAGLPARYVSGHLLGQGGTHAWVEVIVPDGEQARAVAFDPCNDRPAGSGYLTVATGRDYADVAPTSGSYVGASRGRLTAQRRVGVLSAA